MKNEQQEQARDLYIQTNLSKTEIADKIGVNRRTVYQWSIDGDWDVLRQSARCMPSISAQKVYHLIGHFTDHLLQRDSAYQSVNKDDVYVLGRLVNAVTKLKAGSTASENMETFTLFMEGLKQKDGFLFEELGPHVNDFITSKATLAHNSFLMNGFEKNGTKPFPEKDLQEKWQDEKDHEAILAEQKAACHPENVEGQAPESESITYSNGITTRTAPNPNYVPAAATEDANINTPVTAGQQQPTTASASEPLPAAPAQKEPVKKANPDGEFVNGVRQRVMSAA